jgi:microcystin-dependent protein
VSDFSLQGGETAKLTEQERKLIARLFSDPTYFPVEFRTWLKNYIENAGISVSASQIQGTNTLRTGMPAGILIPCASAGAVPPDALVTDGRAVSRTTYSVLFSKIGTAWGAGDGSTTFNLPDVRDRTLFGAGSVIAAAASDGQAAGSRQGPAHGHGTHVHNVGTGNVGGGFDQFGMNTNRQATAGPTDPAQVGPAGALQNTFNWVGVVYAVTTGQS